MSEKILTESVYNVIIDINQFGLLNPNEGGNYLENFFEFTYGKTKFNY